MGTIIALVLLALAVLVTVIVLAVKVIIRVINGDIPVPRSSERTMEERILAEAQEETEFRREELRRERERLEEEHRQLRIRAQNAIGTDGQGAELASLAQSMNQMIRDMGSALGGALGTPARQGVEIRFEQINTVTGPAAPGCPGALGKPVPKESKPDPIKRKSRYERDPVI
jgi:hypothetical protein